MVTGFGKRALRIVDQISITNITNRDIANLRSCDSEPIHIPGSVQAHGFLLGANAAGVVEVCSGNTGALLGREPAEVIGGRLADIIPEELAAAPETGQGIEARIIAFNDASYQLRIHQSGPLRLLEFERLPGETITEAAIFDQTTGFLQLLNQSATLQQLCHEVAHTIQEYTGYDRVMIYRFDADYNGEVYAEAVRNGLNPFLGHRYPHTDIPAQARELYLRNVMRMIVDVDYTPVPLMAVDNGQYSNASVDLGNSVLRSVSPIHIQYLQNMGVKATLVISLILEGKLWGMISCHHYEARNLPYQQRVTALLQGQFLTSQIRVREAAEDFEEAKANDASLQEILPEVTKAGHSMAFVQNGALLRLARANGVALLHNGRLHTQGDVPSHGQIRELAAWLSGQARNGNYYSDALPAVYPAAAAFKGCGAGVLYHALTGIEEQDGVIWFRSEVEKVYSWAGDPTDSFRNDGDKPLTPRKSFELWREQVRGQSDPWRQAERNAAATLAQALQRQFHLLYAQEEEERYRTLSQQLQQANEELSNLNWVSAHDLQEPLRKIRMFSSVIRSTAESEHTSKLLHQVSRIDNAASRMQTLVADLRLYSKAIEPNMSFERTDFNRVLGDVLAELDEDIAEKTAELTVGELPVLPAIPTQIAQLFRSLLGNALKYAEPSRPLRIGITASHEGVDGNVSRQKAHWIVSVRDNGIGFDEAFSDKVFDIFQRLHHREEFSGNGMGLALCRKIMSNHSGTIAVSSKPGVGTEFRMYFPG